MRGLVVVVAVGLLGRVDTAGTRQKVLDHDESATKPKPYTLNPKPPRSRCC